ncbi:regulation of nuclear pre-mRNA domain-containing protein 2-like [Salmo trutta]|uniref:regulation of nuclear pre-mRNA domain-containing protein 2-like n=1 Tax=Salmo trutta TaxID=8032 RepID=UPI00113105EA|nr:regulation of nuclear pre-mRNA domain-containing protein 2-like [Salmo trutta]
MAAGSGAVSGHGGRGALEATLDRRFQGVSNTMESIQGLSTWCIENKKYHSLIVRYWMKWLKKSDTNHRLNLLYLANDVIQNCKRKNAIVYRSAFAEVLPNAALMVKDPKVRKSVERIFTIWEERNVYPEELITQLKANLAKKEREREKEKAKETPPPPAPVNPKAALKSKIVADFIPQSFIEQLAGFKRVVEEEELRETQLTALRVDVCSTEALKRLKDKAGGNKFAKDFEEGGQKLQEFVSFLENQMPVGPPLLEALGNADIFYEMQYKEVKIVASAYKTFANRVVNLKRKLDALKSSLPGPEDSPIPSPSEDAPSPTGSDSPFLGLGGGRGGRLGFDPDLDGSAMDERDMGVVREGDNRDVEDMDLSEEDMETANTAEKQSSSALVSKVTSSKTAAKPAPVTLVRTSTESPLKKAATSTPTPVTPSTPTSAGVSGPSGPTAPLGMNLANVDLGKISSILSSITSAMKNTAASPVSRPSPGTPTTPSGQSSSSKTPVGPTPPSPALASILSRVNVTPEGILNALSKTHTQGLSSLLRSGSSSSSAPSSHASPDSSAAKGPPTPTNPSNTKPPLTNSLKRDTPERSRGARDWEKNREASPPPPPPPLPSRSVSPPSLESKINRFLQGNPGFSLGLGDGSPLLGGDGVDGTPVRDESGGTPTQDEIMDTPGGVSSDPLGLNSDPKSLGSSIGHDLSPTAYRSDPWDAVITPTGSSSDVDFLSSSSRFQGYGAGKKAAKLKEEDSKRKISSSSLGCSKVKKDGQNSHGKSHGNDRSVEGERRASIGSRKTSSGSEEGGISGTRDEKGKRGGEDGGGSSDGEGGQYHRIETLVSPCTEGAPFQSLGGFSNRQPTGERIQTVESIRVIGQGLRRGGGGEGGRPGGGMWYDEEGYLDAQPPSPSPQGGSDDMTSPTMPPPTSHHHPHPHSNHPPHPHPHGPPPQFQMPPYHGENPQGPLPSHLHHHPPPPFFNSPPPPIPRPPPPPMPQLPPPPRNFLPPSAVMVGGVLVPIDRQLPLPPQVRPDGGGDRGGMGGGPRGGKGGPTPLMSSLLGEPPKMPRPGTVKEHFTPRHAPPLHRPGTPGAPPPLLGRVKDGINLPPPSPSPSSSTPPSPSGDPLLPRPQAPPLQHPPASPPAQPRHPNPNHPHRPSPSLLRLPSPNPRPSNSIPQRPLLHPRGPPVHPHLNREPHMFRGGKRPGPPFGGGRGGPFYPPKRPFLPPRY